MSLAVQVCVSRQASSSTELSNVLRNPAPQGYGRIVCYDVTPHFQGGVDQYAHEQMAEVFV